MEKLASALCVAARIREASWDGKMYHATFSDAARRAAREVGLDESAATPVSLLLANSWNDALHWATKSPVSGARERLRRALVTSCRLTAERDEHVIEIGRYESLAEAHAVVEKLEQDDDWWEGYDAVVEINGERWMLVSACWERIV
jgi:hypothetical protein